MPTLLDFVDNPKRSRHRCGLCDSSDGLSIDTEKGDTGTAYCFSCLWGQDRGEGTGAQYLRDALGYELHEAITLLGGPPSSAAGAARDVKRAKKRIHRRRIKGPLYGDFPEDEGLILLEVNRLLASLSDDEAARWNEMQSMPRGEARDAKADRLLREFWDAFHAQDLADGNSHVSL